MTCSRISTRSFTSSRYPATLAMKLSVLLPLAFMMVLSALAHAADSILVISIDALHPAALSARTSPTLQALMQAGRFTLNGRSVDPPKTLIAHTAMLTGLSPAQSGKRDNDWQPGEPQVAKPTLFDDARQDGYRTAYYYLQAQAWLSGQRCGR